MNNTIDIKTTNVDGLVEKLDKLIDIQNGGNDSLLNLELTDEQQAHILNSWGITQEEFIQICDKIAVSNGNDIITAIHNDDEDPVYRKFCINWYNTALNTINYHKDHNPSIYKQIMQIYCKDMTGNDWDGKWEFPKIDEKIACKV